MSETGRNFIRILPYEEAYRDDMIFMVLSAKDALGRVPRLNPDLLDVSACYLKQGDPFWLALDERDRVIGCVGYHVISGTSEVRPQRLYVKPSRERQGIGSRLLAQAENYAAARGKTAVLVHLGGAEYFESRKFYPARGYEPIGPDQMKKVL